MFGHGHRETVKWLSETWWPAGPPVCMISGFPGTGKTEISLRLSDALTADRATLPIAFVDCLETSGDQIDDLIVGIAEQLAAVGDTQPLERIQRGENAVLVASQFLLQPRLIVIDEVQRLFIGATGTLAKATESLLQRLAKTPGARGRLLLLGSRTFDFAGWNGQIETRHVNPLEADEARLFLKACLAGQHLTHAVDDQRIDDVVKWLGCNPRAIRLLVSELSRQSLDDLIGVDPEWWEARDRVVSPDLLLKIERDILSSAEERLDGNAKLFIGRLSVIRQPADRKLLQKLSHEPAAFAGIMDQLASRFMIDLRRDKYHMHPVMRDITRGRLSPAERRRAHVYAGQYYAAPFRAREALGRAEHLGGRFIEARYHFTQGESERDLDDISKRFEAHFRAQYTLVTPVPTDPQQRDERIALLSALLQARGAKGLEYHLARCLVARKAPGDIGRALIHARRATGPQSPEAAWVLRIRLEAAEFGAAEAAKAAREGLSVLTTEQRRPVYEAVARQLSKDGRHEEAITILRQGIRDVPSEHSLFSLYVAAHDILKKADKMADAVEILSEGCKRVNPEHNRHVLTRLVDDLKGKQDAGTDETPSKPKVLPHIKPSAATVPKSPEGGSYTSLDILTAMQPDLFEGLYVLGCYDKTKTVYVQQCRALTLVHALFEAGELAEGRSIGIVGGGAAGVTAAAAAASKGAKVVLFERSDALLSLQRQNTTRLIHPHIIEWPYEGANDSQAGLPLLDWRADLSNKVAAQIVKGFTAVESSTGHIKTRLGVTVQDIERVPSSDNRNRVQIIAAEGGIAELFDVVIVAVGFGLEGVNPLGIESRSYWENDGLDQTLGGSSGRRQRILVSGAGDGALIDLLRASIADFNHNEIFHLLPDGSELDALRLALIDIESKAEKRDRLTNSARIYFEPEYSNIVVDEAYLNSLRKRARTDTEVVFNFRTTGRYSLGSAVINRFLVHLLCRLHIITPKLLALEAHHIKRQPSGAYAVNWSANAHPQEFDRVVVRHGPPADFLVSVFPDLGTACAPLRGKIKHLQMTRYLSNDTRAFYERDGL